MKTIVSCLKAPTRVSWERGVRSRQFRHHFLREPPEVPTTLERFLIHLEVGTPSDPPGQAGKQSWAERFDLWEDDGCLMWVSKENISSIKLFKKNKKQPLKCSKRGNVFQDGVAAADAAQHTGRSCTWVVCFSAVVRGCFYEHPAVFAGAAAAQWCVHLSVFAPPPPLLCQPPLLLYEVLLMAGAIRPAEGGVCCLLLFPALHLNLQLMVRIKGPRLRDILWPDLSCYLRNMNE